MSDLDQAVEKLVREAALLAAYLVIMKPPPQTRQVADIIAPVFLAPMQKLVSEQVALAVAGAYEDAINAVALAFDRREPSANKWLPQFEVAREEIRKHRPADAAQALAERERVVRLDALQEIRAAMPTHDNGEWLAGELDQRIASLEAQKHPRAL